MTNNPTNLTQTTLAVLFAITAFTIWGLSPVYFKQVAQVQATEVLAHRIVWSFLLLTSITLLTGQKQATLALIKNRKTFLTLTISAIAVGLNWLVFIWSIANNHIVDASLGYYLNPIVSVLLGMLVLGEKLNRPQKMALVLASLGVAWQVFALGRLPTVSIVLALSFAFYGLIRKQIAAPAIPGLLVETMVLMPLGLIWLLWLAADNQSAFVIQNPVTCGWLVFAGVITSAPLLLFTSAAPRLRLTTIGFIQYLAPTLALLLGVLVYNETFGFNLKVSFGFIVLIF